jgi:hypothetical protein
MIDPQLINDLVDFLTPLFSDFSVEDENGVFHSMTIVPGFLPPKRTQEDESYQEFIVQVVYVDGESEFNREQGCPISINNMKIIVRTTSNDVVIGPSNTILVMTKIQQAIYTTPILANRYRAWYPMKWTAPVSHAWPFWEGEMTIPYQSPMAQEYFIGGTYNE